MRVGIIFNDPDNSRYTVAGEQTAVEGVLDEVDAVYKALIERGHTVEKTKLSQSLEYAEKYILAIEADILFNLFEGFSGDSATEYQVAAILESNNIRYTGCHVIALKNALYKSEMKEILRQGGIHVPESQLVTRKNTDRFNMTFPCIVKPDSEDASHGITDKSVVWDIDSMRSQVHTMFNQDGYRNILVEEYIEGREFNATVMGNDTRSVIGISEICFDLPELTPKILTYAAKWDRGSQEYQGTKPVCPPDIGEKEYRKIAETAECAYVLASCKGYARVDMRMDEKGDVYVIEVNPNPDISPESGAALHARYAGMDYPSFIEKILDLGAESE